MSNDTDEKSCRVFIRYGGLPASLTPTEDEIRNIFSKHGTIIDLDRRAKFCFIEYENETAAQQAVNAENGTAFRNKTLEVEIAVARKKRAVDVDVAPPASVPGSSSASELMAPAVKPANTDSSNTVEVSRPKFPVQVDLVTSASVSQDATVAVVKTGTTEDNDAKKLVFDTGKSHPPPALPPAPMKSCLKSCLKSDRSSVGASTTEKRSLSPAVKDAPADLVKVSQVQSRQTRSLSKEPSEPPTKQQRRSCSKEKSSTATDAVVASNSNRTNVDGKSGGSSLSKASPNAEKRVSQSRDLAKEKSDVPVRSNMDRERPDFTAGEPGPWRAGPGGPPGRDWSEYPPGGYPPPGYGRERPWMPGGPLPPGYDRDRPWLPPGPDMDRPWPPHDPYYRGPAGTWGPPGASPFMLRRSYATAAGDYARGYDPPWSRMAADYQSGYGDERARLERARLEYTVTRELSRIRTGVSDPVGDRFGDIRAGHPDPRDVRPGFPDPQRDLHETRAGYNGMSSERREDVESYMTKRDLYGESRCSTERDLQYRTAAVDSRYSEQTSRARLSPPPVRDADTARPSAVAGTSKENEQSTPALPVIACEVYITDVQHGDFAKQVAMLIEAANLSVRVTLLAATADIMDEVEAAMSRGALFAMFIADSQSISVCILHGEPEEHRNMLLADAVSLIAQSYNTYQLRLKDGTTATVPAIPGSSPSTGLRADPDTRRLLGLLAADCELNIDELEQVMRYLQCRLKVLKDKKPTAASPAAAASDVKNVTDAKDSKPVAASREHLIIQRATHPL